MAVKIKQSEVETWTAKLKKYPKLLALAMAMLASGAIVITQDKPDAPPPVTPPAIEQPTTPGPSVDWKERMAGQVMFISAPNYHWHEIPAGQIGPWLDAVKLAGLDGVSIEFMGRKIADEYRGTKDHGADVRAIFAQRMQDFRAWHDAAKARGLLLHVAFLNSNWTPIRNASAAEWRGMAEQFAGQYRDNVLLLPVSERDPRCSADRVAAILQGFSGYPSSQLIRYGGQGTGAWNETHSKSSSGVTKGGRTLNVSDSGEILRQMFSDFPADGKKPTSHVAAYVANIRKAGASGAVYSFNTGLPDYLGAVSQAWGATSPPSTADPAKGTLRSARWDGFPKIAFDAPAIEGWKVKTVDGKACVALLYLDGKKVEWVAKGRQWTSAKNAFNSADKKYYRPEFTKGKTVQMTLCDVDGKNASNPLPLIVP